MYLKNNYINKILIIMTEYLRKQRGLTQPIYLIETIIENIGEKIQLEKKYIVMGSSGNVYTVAISHTPTCSCPDYTTRQKRCKHIYFVLGKIMHVNDDDQDNDQYTEKELLRMFSQIPKITNNLIVDTNTKNKYNKLKNNDSSNNKKSTDDLCPICLDDLENGETLDHCRSCGKHIHTCCFSMWTKSKGAKCVFCQAVWKSNEKYINLFG